MVQPRWDLYEAALLLEHCIKVERGEMSRREAVECVSKTLRERAEKHGLKIDGTYRNKSGTSMQMESIRNCYLKQDSSLPVSKFFHEIVDIYNQDRDEFQWILNNEEVVERPVSKGVYTKQFERTFSSWVKRVFPQ